MAASKFFAFKQFRALICSLRSGFLAFASTYLCTYIHLRLLFFSDLAEQIAAIVVLTIIAVGILTACSLAQCYRARTGFFAARRRRDHEARVSSTKANELRQMFRVLSHTGHYDSAAAAERARLMKTPDSAAAKKNSKALLSPCNNDLSVRPIAPAAAAAAAATASGIAKKCRHRSGACGGCSDEKRRLAPLMEHDVKSEEEPGSGLGVMLKTRHDKR